MYYYCIVALNSIFGYFVFSAQALLAGMPPDGPAFLAPRYLGQETRGKRELRACWPSFWAFCSSILGPCFRRFVAGPRFFFGRFVPGSSLLGIMFAAFRAFRSWILVPNVLVLGVLVLGVLVLGVAGIGSFGSSLDSRRARPTIVSPLVTCFRIVAECFKGWFKGCFVGGSVQVIEDILLSERDGGGGSSVLREASESKVTKRRK